MELNERDSILFLISEDDAIKFVQLKKIDAEIIMKMYYEKLRKNLNIILSMISYQEHINELKQKNQ